MTLIDHLLEMKGCILGLNNGCTTSIRSGSTNHRHEQGDNVSAIILRPWIYVFIILVVMIMAEK